MINKDSADQYRVLRGGAFNYSRIFVRCVARGRDNPDLRSKYLGFRVVLSPVSEGVKS